MGTGNHKGCPYERERGSIIHGVVKVEWYSAFQRAGSTV